MPLVIEQQGKRKFSLNYILEIYDILDMSQVLNIPRICMYLMNLNILEFHRCC